MSEKIYSYLGFARKAGKLTAGTDACIGSMARGKVFLLLLAEDLAKGSKDKLMTAADAMEVPCVVFGSKEALSGASGLDNKGVYGIEDPNLARAIAGQMNMEVCS